MNFEAAESNKKSIEEKEPKQPWQMSFSEFSDEYDEVMDSVSKKEKKGKLDPDSKNYELISEEERNLLEKDWKAFSRGRGFSEDDIKEYERWLALSGQRDHLEGAMNDPWRRTRAGHERRIYLSHIDKALSENKVVPSEILREYEKVKNVRSGPLVGQVEEDRRVEVVPSMDTKGQPDIW
jgi:hypothetical protein